MQASKIKQYITNVDAEGVNIEIDVSDRNIMCAGVKVLGVGMYVSTVNEADEGEEAYYCDGDLAVTWDMEGLQNNESARTAGMLLLRNVHSEDDVTKVMGEFYWQHAFEAELAEILVEMGFSAEAAASVHTSEWGMQDEGRASYDAYSIADEVRAALAQ